MLSYWFSASVEYSIFQCLASCSCISTACLVWYSSLGDIIRTILPCSSPDLVSSSWPEVSVSMSPLGYWRNYLSVFGESYWWAWSVMTWPGSYPPYWGWICCDRSLLNPSIFQWERVGRFLAVVCTFSKKSLWLLYNCGDTMDVSILRISKIYLARPG